MKRITSAIFLFLTFFSPCKAVSHNWGSERILELINGLAFGENGSTSSEFPSIFHERKLDFTAPFRVLIAKTENQENDHFERLDFQVAYEALCQLSFVR